MLVETKLDEPRSMIQQCNRLPKWLDHLINYHETVMMSCQDHSARTIRVYRSQWSAPVEEMVFYTNPMSRGRIARWMLEEIGQPYRTELLDYGSTMKAPDYLAINPMGKVPALRHGAGVVTECAAICAYLADAFPQAGLAPAPGSKQRAAYYRWLFFAAGPMESAFTNKSFGFEVPEGKGMMAGYGSLAAVLDAMEYAVSQSPYLAGDQFSAADVYFGSQIGFGLRFGSIEKRPAFEDYWARISNRPAAIRANEIDDALIPAR